MRYFTLFLYIVSILAFYFILLCGWHLLVKQNKDNTEFVNTEEFKWQREVVEQLTQERQRLEGIYNETGKDSTAYEIQAIDCQLSELFTEAKKQLKK